MQEWAELLEQELLQAVEVKDRDSLHRYITLLSRNLVEQQVYQDNFTQLHNEIQSFSSTMKQGFQGMDERFTAQLKQMNARFDAQQKLTEERFNAQDQKFFALQKQMDERFDANQKLMDERFNANQKQMDERFNVQQKLMDERFTQHDKRFDAIHRVSVLGFSGLALLITAFSLVLLLWR